MSNTKEISLTDEMIEKIDNELEGCDHYEGGCLCGYYEIYVKDIGYITVNTHCRKVSECPDGMNWFVEDTAYVWEKSVCMWGYVPTEQEALEDDLKLLGYLDDYSSKEIKQLIREDIMENHSWENTGEYGKQIDYSTEYNDDSEIFEQLKNNNETICKGDIIVSIRKLNNDIKLKEANGEIANSSYVKGYLSALDNVLNIMEEY